MEKQASTLTQKSVARKIILGFSIVVILFFWIGVLTDYSWYDNRVSILYSIIVLCVSVIAFAMSFSLGGLQPVLIILACLLSFPLHLQAFYYIAIIRIKLQFKLRFHQMAQGLLMYIVNLLTHMSMVLITLKSS